MIEEGRDTTQEEEPEIGEEEITEET